MPEILLTGFQPYGGRQLNPSAEIVRALDGTKIGGCSVRGMLLPVSFQAAKQPLEDAIAEHRPVVVVSTGLWPGEPVIRLERVAVNRASFEMPDNDGQRPLDENVDPEGPVARAVTLPVGKIISCASRERDPGHGHRIRPAHSCATRPYTGLSAPASGSELARAAGSSTCLISRNRSPQLLDDLSAEGRLELHQRADLASMSFDMMLDAVRTTLALSLDPG